MLHSVWPTPALPVRDICAPSDLTDRIRELVSLVPPRFGPHTTGPSPLPIFVRPLPALRGLPWEGIIDVITASSDADRIQGVRLARGRAWSARPLRLPLRILAAADVAELLQPFQSHGFVEVPEVQKYGISLEHVDARESTSDALAESRADIVVVRDSELRSVLRACTQLSLPDRPRLIVVVTSTETSDIGVAVAGVPAGMSILRLPLEFAPRTLEEFLLAIVHDCPLHEAAKAAVRAIAHPSAVTLETDPVANHDLRLSDAAAAVAKRTSEA